MSIALRAHTSSGTDLRKTRTVSWSEISDMRQCPHKHDLAYRQRWTPAEPSRALAIGTLWHLVLETHYNALKAVWDLHGKLPASDDELQALVEQAVRPILFPPADEDDEYHDLVRWMYLGHLQKWGFDRNWRIRAVEHPAEIWLPLPSGRPSRFRLKMKMDLIVNVLDMLDEPLWLVDHKSGRDLPTEKELALDDQFGLYTYGMRQLGRPIQGVIYNSNRTQRNKGPMALEDRMARYMLYRTDKELDRIALEAAATARMTYGVWAEGEAPRHTNTDSCKWKCSFTEACLASRKGMDERRFLLDLGFRQDFERH